MTSAGFPVSDAWICRCEDGAIELSRLISLAGGAFLLVLFGFAASRYAFFPHTLFDPAFVAGEALLEKQATSHKEAAYHVDSWSPARFAKTGLTIHHPSQADGGLTLYTTGRGAEAFLLDPEGQQIHSWKMPFHQAWPNPPHVSMPVAERLISWRKAWLLPDGSLIAIYECVGDTPYGYGMVKLDKESKIVWRLAERTHHDAVIRPDGTIHTLTHAFRHDLSAGGLHFVKPPILEDFILVVDKAGKVIRRHSLYEAFVNSPFAGLTMKFMDVEGRHADRFHANSIKIISAADARSFPVAKEGDYLISFRELDVVALFDPAQEKITWIQRGFWFRQHDADLLPGGTMMLFDNGGAFGSHKASRVVEFDPLTLTVVWEYLGEPGKPLVSKLRASQQRLDNGNTFIVESEGGRLLEVTPGKTIVWEYVSPERGGEKGALQAMITDAERYPRSALRFFEAPGEKPVH